MLVTFHIAIRCPFNSWKNRGMGRCLSHLSHTCDFAILHLVSIVIFFHSSPPLSRSPLCALSLSNVPSPSSPGAFALPMSVPSPILSG